MTTPTSAPPSLRAAGPDDARALAEFAARVFADTYGPPFGASAAADVAAYVASAFGPAIQARELADPALRTLLAVEGDAIVGYAQVRRDVGPASASGHAPLDPPAPAALAAGATAELARLYVRRDHHGRGLAARLLAAARETAAAWGATAIWLAAYRENARAVAFYRKHGGVVIGLGAFQMGSERQHDWLIALPTAPLAGIP